MNENNTKKNRPKSQIMMPNSTSPLPAHGGRKNGSSDSLPNHRYENEWEVRSKELAEAKCRVAQMEKTMRWWSDCTDNWRKKWSEVKTERNDLRKELRITKNQMEKMMKQLSPRQKQESLLGSTDGHSAPPTQNGYAIYSNTQAALALSIPACSQIPPYHHNSSAKAIPHDSSHHHHHKNPAPFGGILSRKNAQTQTSALCSSQLSVIDKEIVSLLEEKVAHLTRKLDEVNRRLILERDEKLHLEMTIERLRRDLSDLHELYDSLKKELSDINGKEFTESEVESYAEEEGEEARLIQQLAQDGDEVDDLEEDEFDPENETEVDKHTPTAENPVSNTAEPAQDADVTIPSQESSEKKNESTNHDTPKSPTKKSETSAPPRKHDLASSIQVEISEVHKKLDLKTFINDVTELVGSCPNGGLTTKVNGQAESTVDTSRQTSESGANIVSGVEPSQMDTVFASGCELNHKKSIEGIAENGNSESNVENSARVDHVNDQCTQNGIQDTVTSIQNGHTVEEPETLEQIPSESKGQSITIEGTPISKLTGEAPPPPSTKLN